MSSRDIDSTSENVLHDWARDEDPDVAPEALDDEAAEPGESDEHGSPAWGAASARADREEGVVSPAVEAEPDEGELELEPAVVDDDVAELGDAEIEEAPMLVELSHEHAAGDLHIPDGYAVLEGEPPEDSE